MSKDYSKEFDELNKEWLSEHGKEMMKWILADPPTFKADKKEMTKAKEVLAASEKAWAVWPVKQMTEEELKEKFPMKYTEIEVKMDTFHIGPEPARQNSNPKCGCKNCLGDLL